MSNDVILLARQPIFDRNMEIYAYELLYRSPHSANTGSSDGGFDGDTASSQVLLNAFTELSIEEVVGEHKAFINFTGALLNSQLPFNNKQLVIEVLEDQKIEPQLIQNLKRLRSEGYTIALDDFELTPETSVLVPYADIIKLDILALSESRLEAHVHHLKKHAQLLAEKIETHEQLEHCKSLGFELFQGYFLSRPNLVMGGKVCENRQAVVSLLAQLNNPTATLAEIETLISRDPLLSYKLLRLMNSGAFHFVQVIESLRQAITLLGLDQIKGWANLMALAQLEDKPKELITIALTRARLCQTIGEKIAGKAQSESFFTAGLLSTVDAFLDKTLPEILDSILLSDELKTALLEHKGLVGEILDSVIHYEHGEWNTIDWPLLQSHNITEQIFSEEYKNALQWVEDIEH